MTLRLLPLTPTVHACRLSWYVGEKFLRDLRAKEEFSTRVLESIEAVACFLVSQAREIERGSEAARREAKEQVPADRVKDPSAIARELRWRVRAALGVESDGEDAGTTPRASSSSSLASEAPSRGVKRRRPAEDGGAHLHHHHHAVPDAQPFRNFQPKPWECVERKSEQRTERTVHRVRPGDGELLEKAGWLAAEVEAAGAGAVATVSARHVVTTKVRRTGRGLERQRVESVLEKWDWDE